MPYIDYNDRANLEPTSGRDAFSMGELNFQITRLVTRFLYRGPFAPRYEDYNTVVGVLEAAKLEFYRRMAAPYEDNKKDLNGDVYD